MEKNSRFLKTYIKTDIHIGSYLTPFFVECEMFQLKVVEKIKIHILCAIYIYIYLYLFSKIMSFMR